MVKLNDVVMLEANSKLKAKVKHLIKSEASLMP